VDDDATNLNVVAECLSVNYDVLTATSAEQALQQSKDFKDEIHLLLSDLQMPGMTGIDLATQITVQRPQLKSLLMSGFSGGMLVLNEGWHFLPTPFIPSQLRTLVAGLISPDETRYKAA
jgi:CheY-like chemotaxis protein